MAEEDIVDQTLQVAETDLVDGVNQTESAPVEPSFDELIEQFERETAQPQPAAEPGADSGEPVLGATQAPAEQVPQPEPLPDPVAKILADNLLPAELRQEAAQVDAAR